MGHGGMEIANMALSFGQADIVKFKHAADRVSAKARAYMARTDQAIEAFATTSEVSATAFLFGLAQGKWGGVAFFGIPVDLLAGAALHIVAFATEGKLSKSSHLHNIGDGALSSFFGGLGRQVGRQLQTPADRERIMKHGGKYAELPGGAYTVGGATGGASMADEELARMVAAGRK
jgi:hypothetical protein